MTQEPNPVYSAAERRQMLIQMHAAADQFYRMAILIHNHPFIEFTGLIKEYVSACNRANAAGIDFTQCSKHSGRELPMEQHQIDYVNEKLECIFSGRVMMRGEKCDA